MKNILIGLIVVAAFAFTAIGYAAPWYTLATPPNKKRPVEVTIARGDTLTTASEKLATAGLVSSATRFRMLARVLGSSAPIKAGEYAFMPSFGWQRYLETMQSGVSLQRFVTIPEGMPSILVQEQLSRTPLLKGIAPLPPEGSVLPDSYAYQRGETRGAVLARMQKEMQTAMANAWKARKPSVAVNSPAQAITLASIVEKETGVASERRMVAAVYTNRLKRGMPLQADPTLIYPVTRGRPIGRRILRSELESDSPWNTYRRAGLPPGPITNPGKASIVAALDPARSNALYFVAKGDGSSVFADTLARHQANVAKWYAIRRARGEM